MTKDYIEGVIAGISICKEMWAQGTISWMEMCENEIYYKELLENTDEQETETTSTR